MVVLEVMVAAFEWSSHPSWGPISFPTADGGSLEGTEGPADHFQVRDYSMVFIQALLQFLHFIILLFNQQILIIYYVPGVGLLEIKKWPRLPSECSLFLKGKGHTQSRKCLREVMEVWLLRSTSSRLRYSQSVCTSITDYELRLEINNIYYELCFFHSY